MSDKVNSFLDTVTAFVEGLKERNLQDFTTPDFVQKCVTSIYISENQPQKSAAAAKFDASAAGQALAPGGGDKKTVTGTLQKKKAEARTGADGKQRQQYSVQIDGQWFNTLQKAAFGGLQFNEGDTVAAEVQQKGKYWNLLSLKPVAGDDDPFAAGDEIPF